MSPQYVDDVSKKIASVCICEIIFFGTRAIY